MDSLRISTTSFTSPGPLASTGQLGNFQTIVPHSNQVYNQSDAAFGMKISAFDHLLFTANAIVALNNGGLRQKVTPLVAVSYVF